MSLFLWCLFPSFLNSLHLLLLFTFCQVCLPVKETAEIKTGMAEKSSWDTREKLGLFWINRKKISQIIKDYLYLPFFLLIFYALLYIHNSNSTSAFRREGCGLNCMKQCEFGGGKHTHLHKSPHEKVCVSYVLLLPRKSVHVPLVSHPTESCCQLIPPCSSVCECMECSMSITCQF